MQVTEITMEDNKMPPTTPSTRIEKRSAIPSPSAQSTTPRTMRALYDTFDRILGFVGLSSSPSKQSTLCFKPISEIERDPQSFPYEDMQVEYEETKEITMSEITSKSPEDHHVTPSTPKRKSSGPLLGSPSRNVFGKEKRHATASKGLMSPFQTRLVQNENKQLSLESSPEVVSRMEGIKVTRKILKTPTRTPTSAMREVKNESPNTDTPSKLLSSPRRNLRTKSKQLTPIPTIKVSRLSSPETKSSKSQIVECVQITQSIKCSEVPSIAEDSLLAKTTSTPSLGRTVLLRETNKLHVKKTHEASGDVLEVELSKDSVEVDAFTKLITSSPRRPTPSKIVKENVENLTTEIEETGKSSEAVDKSSEKAPLNGYSENPFLAAQPAVVSQVSMSGSNLFSPEFPHVHDNNKVDEVKEIVMHDYPELETEDELEPVDEDLYDATMFIASLPQKSLLPPHPAMTSTNPFSPKYSLIPPKDPSDTRLTLVLDLDETLVHCAIGALEPCDRKMEINVPGREAAPIEVSIRWRPHLFSFLAAIKDTYEVIVFTASQKIYADTLLDIVDPNREIIQYRLFRDSCRWVNGNFIKDLEVLERDLSRTIIVDNAYQAYSYHVSNGYPIVSWYDDPHDRQLLDLLAFLAPLNNKPDLDVRPILRRTFPLYKKILRYRKTCSITTQNEDFPPTPTFHTTKTTLHTSQSIRMKMPLPTKPTIVIQQHV